MTETGPSTTGFCGTGAKFETGVFGGGAGASAWQKLHPEHDVGYWIQCKYSLHPELHLALEGRPTTAATGLPETGL